MTPKTRKMLLENISSAIASGFEMRHDFSVVENNGRYIAMPGNGWAYCHPLETLIINQPIKSYLNVDIANNLGVSLQWVEGFKDGYSASGKDKEYMNLSQASPARRHYLEGYQDGQQISRYYDSMES